LRRPSRLVTVLAALIAVPALLGGCGGGDDDDGSSDGAATPTATSTSAPAATEPAEALGPDASIPRDGTLLGDPSAPVDVVEFVDYQCPNCARFAAEIEPTLIDEYVATGEMVIDVRNFTIIGEESVTAAMAAECAADQNLYWEYRELLFGAQTGENVGDFTPENLKSIAAEVPGIEQQVFDECLDSETHLATVEADSEAAREIGLRGTPGFVVAGQAFSGSPDIEGWREIVEAVLEQ
jgi:protein-disulfide isomerase